MEPPEKRKFKRVNVQFDITLKVVLQSKAGFKINCVTENISQGGIGLAVRSNDGIENGCFTELIKYKKHVVALIMLPDNFCVRAGCQVVYEKFWERGNYFKIGLKILELTPPQKKIWSNFIEELATKEPDRSVWYTP